MDKDQFDKMMNDMLPEMEAEMKKARKRFISISVIVGLAIFLLGVLTGKLI